MEWKSKLKLGQLKSKKNTLKRYVRKRRLLSITTQCLSDKMVDFISVSYRFLFNDRISHLLLGQPQAEAKQILIKISLSQYFLCRFLTQWLYNHYWVAQKFLQSNIRKENQSTEGLLQLQWSENVKN